MVRIERGAEGRRRGGLTRRSKCSTPDALHLGGQWQYGRDISKRNEEEMLMGSGAKRWNHMPVGEAKRRTRGCLFTGIPGGTLWR